MPMNPRMKHLIATLTATVIVSACSVAPTTDGAAPTVAVTGFSIPLNNPSFIANAEGKLEGWKTMEHNLGGSYTFMADSAVAYSGTSSARIRRQGDEAFGLLEQSVRTKPEWINKTVRLSGYLKTDKVDGNGGALVIQARGDSGNIMEYNHMNSNRVKGTQPWKNYAVTIKIPQGTYQLQVGVMLEDGGTLWADDLKLELLDQ